MRNSWRRYWGLVVLGLLLLGCKPLKHYVRRTFPRQRTYSTSTDTARYLRRADVVGTELDTGRFEVLHLRRQQRTTSVRSYPFHVGFGSYEQELFVRCRQLADLPVGQPLPLPHPGFVFTGYDSRGLYRSVTGTITRLNNSATQPCLQFDLRCIDKQGWAHSVTATHTFQLDSAWAGRVVGKDYQGQYDNLRLALKEPTKVIKLDLKDYAVQQHLVYGDHSPFDSLYARLGELVNVEEMNLSLSHLNEMPPLDFSRLKRLRKLNLSYTRLARLSPELLALDSLRELNLEWNWLDSIPAEIRQLHGLRVLNLTSNTLARYPEAINSLTGLRELYLGNASLHGLPNSISRLQQLEVLGLRGVWGRGNRYNQFTNLDVLQGLPNLRRLDLQGALPGPVPDVIYRLPRLEELDISNNRLDSTAVDRQKLPALKKLVWQWHN